jgi:hypothetical protein
VLVLCTRLAGFNTDFSAYIPHSGPLIKMKHFVYGEYWVSTVEFMLCCRIFLHCHPVIGSSTV